MKLQTSLQITVGATEARTHFSELLKRVHRGKEHLVVEKGGIPVAAIIGIREYDNFVRWQAQQELHVLGPAMAEQVQYAGISEDQLAMLLEEDRRAVYRANYGNQSAE